MSKPNRKAVQKMISIFPAHQVMIDRFLLVKGIASTSELFRQALVFYYEETFKDAYDTVRKQQLEAQQVKAMEEKFVTDEEFALQTLNALIVKDSLENKFFIIYWFQNKEFAHFPLVGVKEWALENKAAIEDHLRFSKEKPIKDFDFSQYSKDLYERNYGIILP